MTVKIGYSLSTLTATVKLSNFYYAPIIEGPATITYNEYGSSVTVGGTAVANGGTSATVPADGTEFVATPASGATFVAWINKDTNEILSQEATATIKPYATSMNIEAVFTKSTETAYYKVGTTLYTDLSAAITAASSATVKTVVVISDGTLPASSTFTIPSGVTLLAPYVYSDTSVATATATVEGTSASTWEYANATFKSDWTDDGQVDNILLPNKDVTYTLTIPSGTTVNVASGGKFVIGGTIGSGHENTAGIVGATAGAHSNVQLEGTVNVQNGGILSACGYVLGSGTVNINSGGTVYQPFTLMDHRDGHYVCISNNDETLPFARYSFQNIQCNTHIVYGGIMKAYYDIYTQTTSALSGFITIQERHNVTCNAIVGTSGAIYNLGENCTLDISYDATRYVNDSAHESTGLYSRVGTTTLSFNGNASLGALELSISVAGTDYDLSSTTDYFMLPYNYIINLNSGTFTVVNDMKLMPGSVMNVNSGATLNVTANLAVMDGFRDHSARATTANADSYMTVYHYPCNDVIKASFGSGVADLVVNGGTINVTGTLGGVVQTKGTGTVNMKEGSGNSLTLITGVESADNVSGLIDSCTVGRTTRTLAAQMFNRNGQRMTLEAGKSYVANDAETHTIDKFSYTLYNNYSDSSSTIAINDVALNATVVGSWKCADDAHADAADDGDHKCDFCGTADITVCGDGEKDHICDSDTACTAYSTGDNEHKNESTTSHTCAYCGKAASTCKDHATATEAKAATCTAKGNIAYWTCGVCGKIYSDADCTTETTDVSTAIDENAHTWGTVTYAFTTDGKSCTATRPCTNSAAHNLTETVTTAGAQSIAPTCSAKGTTTYTATFTVDWAATQTKDVQDIAIDADAHKWDEGAQTKAPTCSAVGTTTYTCSYNAQHTRTEEIAIVADAHEWNDATYDFAADGKSCTAARVCKHNSEHKETATATITSAVKTPAACETMGTTTYTATFTDVAWATTQTKDVQDIAAPSHTDATGDGDHKCDNEGCDKIMSSCSDAAGDNNHNCDECNKADVTAHTYVDKIVAPKCEVEGYTEHTCSECGDTYKDTYVDALEHDFTGDGEVTEEATCTQEGVMTYTCTLCKIETTTKTIDKLPHTEGVLAAVPATCTTTGLTEGKECTECHTVLEEQSVIDVLGHKYETYTYNNDATCVADGTETAQCIRCDETDTRTAADTQLEHKYTTYSPNNDATCAKNATETATCDYSATTNCGAKDTRTIENSTVDHKFTTYTYNDDAKCGIDGTKTAVCDYGCGTTDVIAAEGTALSHSYTNYIYNNDAKCEVNGTETAVCDHGCGTKDTRNKEGTALEHSFTNYVPNDDAVCGVDGTKTASCDNGCGKTDTVTNAGSAKVHSFTKYVSDGNATCTTDGTKTASCDYNCGTEDTQTDTGSALNHSYNSVYTAPTFDADGYTTYTCVRGDHTYTVTDEGSQLVAVAKIGDQRYETLNEAIEAAKASEEENVEIVLLTKLVINDDVTWDLDGITLTTYDKSDNYSIVINGSLTIESGSFNVYGIYGIGVASAGKLTVNGGEISYAGDSDYLIGNWGTTVINGGTFSGQYCCVNNFGGTTIINDGSFKTEETDSTGEYDSEDVLADEGMTISGGTFSKAPDTALIITGYCAQETDEGLFVVAEHVVVDDAYVAPKCEATGLTAGSHCDECGTVIVAQTVISATGHTEADAVKENEVAATCKAEGSYDEVVKCLVCSKELSRTAKTIEKLPHTEVIDAAVAPTCTETGLTEGKHCGVCDEVIIAQTVVDELGHSYTGEVTTQPTCATEGVKTYTCGNCGDNYTEAIAIDKDKHVEIVKVDATESTCIEAGCDAYEYCTGCEYTTIGDALELAAHTATKWTTDSDNHWKICTVDGCGATFDEGEHNYVDGECSVCGYVEEVVEKFKIAAANVKLGDSLDMFFYVKYSDLNGEDYYAEITRTYADEEPETIRVPYAEWEPYSTSMIRVAYNGLAAKEMTDELYVTIYSNDGTAVSETKIDSIKAYTMRIFDSQKDETKTVLADMLNYGAEAQKFFDYNVDNLANTDLTSEQQAYATETVSPVDNRVKGDNYAGSTVTLKSEMYLTFYFKNITPDMYAEVTYTDHYGNEEKLTVNGANFKPSGTMYGISATGLAVADGMQLITCKVYDETGNEVAYAVDSTESYVARMSETDEIYEAVMKFVVSAYNYFH